MAKNPMEEKCFLGISESEVLNFLIKFSSQSCPVSINDMAVYFNLCAIAAAYKGLRFAGELSAEDIRRVDRVYLEYRRVGGAMINESARTYAKRKVAALLDRPLLLGMTLRCLDPKIEAHIINERRAEKTAPKTRREKPPTIDSRTRLYYLQTPFTETDIMALRSAIIPFSQTDPEITERIVNGLNALTPLSNREAFFSEASEGKRRGECGRNLEVIRRALFPTEGNIARKKLRFQYCRYNAELSLEPFALPDGKMERVVNPVRVMCANGRYYLVAFSEPADGNAKPYLINYRIDRMKDVECLAEDALSYADFLRGMDSSIVMLRKQLDSAGSVPRTDRARIEKARGFDSSGFPAARYRQKHPVMYSGEPNKDEHILLKCKTSLLNTVVDVFGTDVEIKTTADPETVIVTIRETPQAGVALWALEYCESCEVLEPKALRERMARAAEKLVNTYCTKDTVKS